MKTWLLGLLIGLSCHSVASAQVFQIRDASKLYNVKMQVNCDQQSCSGKGTVSLYKKSDQSLLQKFVSDDLDFDLSDDLKPSANIIELYGEQSPLIFDDFNFDGTEDIAIRNGNEGPYGGPTYDVYVYNKTHKHFVFSSDLSALTHENLGMFHVDHDNKRIHTLSKSGCCYHIAEEYQVIPKKGLVKVKEFIEDATLEYPDGEKRVTVTERHLIKGKWVENVKRYPLEDYYQD